MQGRSLNGPEPFHLYKQTLMEQLDPDNELLCLSRKIGWQKLEQDLSCYYSDRGRQAKPIRLMSGLLILKYILNYSDARMIKEFKMNPYYQKFCGFNEFTTTNPCHESDLTHFRKRIGKEGIEKIFAASVEINKQKAMEEDVIIDTTVQEKNITYPTDIKLYLKIIAYCRCIAEVEQINLRRSYRYELPELIRTSRFCRGKKNRGKAVKANKRIKKIAFKISKDLKNKLINKSIKSGIDAFSKYDSLFEIFTRVINQKREDHNKVYSIHEPQVLCIKKGKVHKNCEFGSKVSIAVTKTTGIIVGAVNFSDCRHDSKTLDATIQHIKSTRGVAPTTVFADRGFRGISQIEDTRIIIPAPPKKDSTEKDKAEARMNFRRRSAIEPVIGHLKSDFRMGRNFLKGICGDAINLLMAAAAFNFRKWMRGIPPSLLLFFFALRLRLSVCLIRLLRPLGRSLMAMRAFCDSNYICFSFLFLIC